MKNFEMDTKMNKLIKVKQIQNIILDIFKIFKDICKKYNLTYFAIGGTCLGAVRHKGFIPWDDDMDVAMPYEDYKKFIEIAKKELKHPYSLILPKENKHFYGEFIKIHKTETTFILDFYVPYTDTYMGVWLDVMPIFGCPKKKKFKYVKKLNFWLGQNSAFRFSIRQLKSYGRKFYWLISIWQRITKKPFYYFIDKIENEFGKIPFSNSDKILFGWRESPLTPWHHTNYKTILEYNDFSSAMEVPFEDTTIAIPIGYDNYLKMDFGDYMKLPPEDKRIPLHGNAIIDLEKPYSYYQDQFKKGDIK